MDDFRLRNIWSNRQRYNRISSLTEPLEFLMRQRLAKRVKQIGQLATAWDECIPDELREHAALVKFSRGVLTVAVDSAPHRYHLQMLLQSGLMHAIRERFAGGALNQIKLVAGQFDALEFPDSRRRAN